MESLWNATEADACGDDPVALRAYTSRLMGVDPTLVLHGGGNTSVKVTTTDFFGDAVELLYVKGSGWDLKTIAPAGFAPVRLDVLRRMADLDALTDSDMVRVQRAAMINPDAPNPSVEAILHAVLPFRYVDHSHSDAVVTITNTPGGAERIRAIYGDRVVVVPYVMPGFKLAQAIWRQVRDLDWEGIEGLILLNHGVFTFAETARESYERMIRLVGEAEAYLQAEGAWEVSATAEPAPAQPERLAALRRAVSDALGAPVVTLLDRSPEAVGFANRADVAAIAGRGPVTPDHIIRTKRVPLFVSDDVEGDVARYGEAYRAYFARHTDGGQACLDPAPRWAVWPGQGVVSFGKTFKEARIVRDIARHTMTCIQRAEALGGWQALGEAELFEMEYWELEQAKLKRGKQRPPFAGRVALVTGAASGIGRATVTRLAAQGAAVVAEVFERDSAVAAVVADLTDSEEVTRAVEAAARRFGGLDMVVSCAGTFPPSATIEAMNDALWEQTLAVNVTSHQKVLRAAAPLLRHGHDPAVVIVASKNVPAPGPGMSAYSAAKAALTQLGRVAALELGGDGVRVNVLHPNAVFDTGFWDDGVIAARAAHYGLSPEAYRARNVLGVEIRSEDVARLIEATLGPAFRCTTGAQIPIDGGNERVI